MNINLRVVIKINNRVNVLSTITKLYSSVDQAASPNAQSRTIKKEI